jgi:drug/metabolite transporter (DMT)-like permease
MDLPLSQSAAARQTKGYAAALISSVLLSTTAIFIRQITQNYGLPALALAAWRDLMVSLSLLIILLAVQPRLLRVTRAQLGFLAAFGIVVAIFNSLWTLSVAVNGAAVATVLVYCSAAFTALLGRWLLKEPLTPVKIAAVVLCLAGCVLVANALDPAAWRANLLGILTGVLAGLLYAAYSLVGRVASQRGLNPWTTLLYSFAFATLYLAALNLLGLGRIPGAAPDLPGLLWTSAPWQGWLFLLLLAAGPTLGGFGFYNISLSLLPSSIANLIATTEPAFTAVQAYLIFGERLSAIQIVGSLLILSGVILLRLFEGRSQR